MYAFKSMTLMCLETYENNRDSFKGISMFFHALTLLKCYGLLYEGKPYDFKESKKINRLLFVYQNAETNVEKNRYLTIINKIIDIRYKDILKFIDVFKKERPEQAMFSQDRTKVKGCWGTVLR